MISHPHPSSHGDTPSRPPCATPGARPSSASSREPAEWAAVSATNQDDPQPTVDEMLRSSDWESRLAEARARRQAMLARKSARNARRPGPQPDVGSDRSWNVPAANGNTHADMGEVPVPTPLQDGDIQDPAPVETTAGNTGPEERGHRTWSPRRAGLGFAAGTLIGLAVVPMTEVLTSPRADPEDAVEVEVAAPGSDVRSPPSRPSQGAPITPIVPTSARTGTIRESKDDANAATSGGDRTFPETARWAPYQIEAPAMPERPSGIQAESAVPSGCAGSGGMQFCGIRVAFVVSSTVTDDRVHASAAPLADHGVAIEPARRTSLAPPGRTVRYFHDRDAASARAVAGLLDAAVVALPTYRPRPAPGTIEVIVGVE